MKQKIWTGFLIFIVIFVFTFVQSIQFKWFFEDEFKTIHKLDKRLSEKHGYLGYQYGHDYKIRDDTVWVYIYVDSIRVYSGQYDTVMVLKKQEQKTSKSKINR